MRLRFVTFVFLFTVNAALSAATIGVEANGTCEAGNCPAKPIPFNTTETLTFDFTFVLPNNDTYLIYGSFIGTNDSNGSSASNTYKLQVNYEGNANGGPSAADTITVQRDAAFMTSISSALFDTTLIGAFSPGIAASSSASTCFDVNLACLGPVKPPGSFSQTSSTVPI